MANVDITLTSPSTSMHSSTLDEGGGDGEGSSEDILHGLHLDFQGIGEGGQASSDQNFQECLKNPVPQREPPTPENSLLIASTTAHHNFMNLGLSQLFDEQRVDDNNGAVWQRPQHVERRQQQNDAIAPPFARSHPDTSHLEDETLTRLGLVNPSLSILGTGDTFRRLANETHSEQPFIITHPQQPQTGSLFHTNGDSARQENSIEQFGSADHMSRTDMGYTTHQNHGSWSQQYHSPTKMETTERDSRQDEGKCQEDDALSAASTASATTLSPHVAPMQGHVEREGRLPLSALGTPSTISTAFSENDNSVDGGAGVGAEEDFEKLTLRTDLRADDGPFGFTPSQPQPTMGSVDANRTPVVAPSRRGPSAFESRPPRIVNHRGPSSWEHGPPPSDGTQHYVLHPPQQHGAQPAWGKLSPTASPSLGPTHVQQRGHRDTWSGGTHQGQSHQGQVRVASFRSNHGTENAQHHHEFNQGHGTLGAWGNPRPQQRMAHSNQGHADHGGVYRNTSYQQPPRKPYTQHAHGQGHTPPRTRPRSHQKQHGSPSLTGSPGPTSSNHSRSSSEVLKTLLRKKACLYEPETSRAVAMVTWLVGRELAMEYGYFSRQQLQSGVHACVADKIESGTITRTKVNRCMQIILNSCFHYIIPRPDGTEENGEMFKKTFGDGAEDDSALLSTLSPPWDGIRVERELVLKAWTEEDDKKRQASPQASPHVGSMPVPDDSNDVVAKRAVLLCFNENVRNAVDVFRCHNEFIRDTANTSKLQLTAQEWRAFFGGNPTGAPFMWSGNANDSDQFGTMSTAELANFRTTWCSKRYEHDHSLCGFAHVEVNGGWLRRNPGNHNYRTEMCGSVIAFSTTKTGAPTHSVNSCPLGVDCPCAHSKEEILYHPQMYKKKLCKSTTQGPGCHFGDVCPDLHQIDPYHSSTNKKQHSDGRHGYRRHHDHRHHHHHHHHHHNNVHHHGPHSPGATGIPPLGSPMFYVHPAPFSNFEKQLVLPGLQNLFRQNSAVTKARISNTRVPDYSLFPGGSNA